MLGAVSMARGKRRSMGRRSPGEYAMMWQCSCLHFLFDSRPADDPPEPQRLEPVGVEGREVDDRVGPYRYADERGAHSLIVPGGALLLVLERLLARRSRFTKRLMWATKFNRLRRARSVVGGCRPLD